MRHPLRTIAFFVLLVSCMLVASQAKQHKAVVNGQLMTSANRQPASGLLVSLVHPRLGRSVSATTNKRGEFTFFGIPLRRDPYYLEVYWGKQLVYRQTVSINNRIVNLPPHFI